MRRRISIRGCVRPSRYFQTRTRRILCRVSGLVLSDLDHSTVSYLGPDVGVSEAEFAFGFFLTKDPNGDAGNQRSIEEGAEQEEDVDGHGTVPGRSGIRLVGIPT